MRCTVALRMFGFCTNHFWSHRNISASVLVPAGYICQTHRITYKFIIRRSFDDINIQINYLNIRIMAVTSGVSFILSSIITVIVFSGMQMYRSWLTSSQLHTILGGYIGSLLFVFILTALGNLESTIFGRSFQLKFFPEVFISLIFSMIASGLVHRVSTTTCFLFSIVALYYVNKISQEHYATPTATTTLHVKKRK